MKRARGFSLVEVMLATALLATGIALAFATFANAAKATGRAEEMAQRMQFKHEEVAPVGADDGQEPAEQASAAPAAPVTRDGPKVGRNDPCPCGSGKKYKQCHGKLS